MAFQAASRLAGRHRSEWDDEEWPERESLDYVGKEAYALAAGNAGECGSEFYDAVDVQLSTISFRRNPDGERWPAKDEATASRKIPLLAEYFPLT